MAQSCLTLCNPMNYSTPGSLVLHYFPEFVQTHVYWDGDAIQPSSSVNLFSSCLQSFPASGSFPVSWLFTLGGQSIGASASVLPMHIHGWAPLGWTGWISLLSVFHRWGAVGAPARPHRVPPLGTQTRACRATPQKVSWHSRKGYRGGQCSKNFKAY